MKSRSLLRTKLIAWLIGRLTPAPTVAPSPEPATSREPAKPIANQIKPTAVEILQNEPNLSPAELAERAGVTLSYARTLVRKQRPKSSVPAPVRALPGRTESTEPSCRAKVIERVAAGAQPKSVSEDLGVPVGEVDFILKVARLQKKL